MEHVHVIFLVFGVHVLIKNSLNFQHFNFCCFSYLPFMVYLSKSLNSNSNRAAELIMQFEWLGLKSLLLKKISRLKLYLV